MGFLHGLLHRENKWLIGVYKGRLITVSEWEKNQIWKQSEKIRSTGLFKAVIAREKLEPYFFPLEPVHNHVNVEYGDEQLLDRYGLDQLAYKYKGPPIPAYGHSEEGGFVLGVSVARRYKDFFNSPSGANPCVLALKTKWNYVRTGTFFKPKLEGGKIVFEPCKHRKEYLVGKGVLTGIDLIELEKGYMTEDETAPEESCPVSKLCVCFYDWEWKPYYMVYREVSTDLRADMPLAMLKISGKNAFERMFKKLGGSVKWQLTNELTCLDARNVLLDGTIVDYADIKQVDITDPKEYLTLGSVNKEIGSMMLSAALISVARKDALLKMREGEKGLAKLIKEHEKEIFEKYDSFFKCFSEGLGEGTIRHKKITEYFHEAKGWLT